MEGLLLSATERMEMEHRSSAVESLIASGDDRAESELTRLLRDMTAGGSEYRPWRLRALLAQAVLRRGQGDPASALVALDEVISQQRRDEADDLVVHVRRGWSLKLAMLTESGDDEALRSALKEALTWLSAFSGRVDGRQLLGEALRGCVALREAGRPDACIEPLERLSALCADHPNLLATALVQLALCLAELGLPERSATTAGRVLLLGDEAEGQRPLATLIQASQLMVVGRHQAALDALGPADASGSPRTSQIVRIRTAYLRAEVYHALRRDDEAMRSLQLALAVAANIDLVALDRELHSDLTRLLRKLADKRARDVGAGGLASADVAAPRANADTDRGQGAEEQEVSARALHETAVELARAGRLAEAHAANEELLLHPDALPVLEDLLARAKRNGAEPETMVFALLGMSYVFARSSRPREAIAVLDELIALTDAPTWTGDDGVSSQAKLMKQHLEPQL